MWLCVVCFHPSVNILDLLLKKGGSMHAQADHQMSCVLVEHFAVGAAGVLLPSQPEFQPFSCSIEARALLAVPEIYMSGLLSSTSWRASKLIELKIVLSKMFFLA